MKIHLPFENVRTWQVPFEVNQPFSTLPYPTVVVEEHQHTPLYRQDGRVRKISGSQLSITLSGRGAISIGETVYALTPGKAFLHNHSDPEVCYFYPQDGTEPWRTLWISFGGEAAENAVREINLRYGYLYDVPENSPLRRKLMDYRNYHGELQIISPLSGAKLVFDLLSMLCAPGEESLRQSPRTILVHRVQSRIAGSPPGDIRIGNLAEDFQLSREHLSRIFREETGIPLQEYILNRRLQIAEDLLRQTQLQIKEVAFRSGWSKYSIFARIFRQKFGCTPMEMRRFGGAGSGRQRD